MPIWLTGVQVFGPCSSISGGILAACRTLSEELTEI
ncbi:hypothetical protein A2U01_0068912, partial [Trifolium medium]|nr:hypothetical protein [Trifolium medium]